MSRTTRVKNKNERKYLIGHDFWRSNNNEFHRIRKYDYWRAHLQAERLAMNARQEFEREDNQISRGYDCEVSKTGNYSNKSCRQYANLGRAGVRDQLRKIDIDNYHESDVIDDRKYRICGFRWFITW